MDLSQARLEVLEALFLQDKPVRASAIAKEAGKEVGATQMHLIGLVKKGDATSSQKGVYDISEKGKNTLGPEINKQKALEVLARVPHEKAFYFFGALGKPLNMCAQDFFQFCYKLDQIPAESLELHLKRGDFENWFKLLGDYELALKASLLKVKKMTAEELRDGLRDLAQQRCVKLATIAGRPDASQ